MRPFPRRQLVEGGEKDVFNYRLARARMVIEYFYGSINSKFHVLSVPIETKVQNSVVIVKAITLLHNIIREPEEFTDDKENSFQKMAGHLTSVRHCRENNSTSKQAMKVREKFASYFIHEKGSAASETCLGEKVTLDER